MTKEEFILSSIGEPAALEQLAEECAELGKAALKLARIERGENPTPVTRDAAIENLTEEMADVMCVIHLLPYKPDDHTAKMERWVSRVEGGKDGELNVDFKRE